MTKKHLVLSPQFVSLGCYNLKLILKTAVKKDLYQTKVSIPKLLPGS